MARQRLALVGAAALVPVALLAATAGSPAAGASAPAAVGASRAPSAQVKKKCKIVIKVIHGKKRKVRVCHTVKPKPKPTVKNVSLSLDTGRAATQTIGAEGGSVTATAANGTTYTLALPADALVGPTEVQVIPVKSVTGLGGHARVVGGVQFEPEGLGLFKPATLTITPSSLSGKPTQAFGWYGTGRTLGRYPSTRTGKRLVLQIAHFSGDGVAQGESTDWSNWESATDAQRAYYQQSLRPLMTKAETDDSVFFDATAKLIGWERQLQIDGYGADFMAAERAGLLQSFEKAFQNAVNKSFERCVNQHKLEEITILLLAAREAVVGAGLQQLSNDAVEKLKKCGHFEFDFETIMTSTAHPPNFSSELKVESHVRVLGLQLALPDSLAGRDFTGEKQIEYLSWNYTGTATIGDSSCSYTPDGTQLGDPFRVTGVSGLLPRLKEVPGDGRPQFDPPSISLSVYPGKPMESAKIECSDGFQDVIPVQPWYYAVFSFLNYQQAEGDNYRIDDWDFLGGSVYARKTYVRTRPSTEGLQQTSSERTTYDLRHTPQS